MYFLRKESKLADVWKAEDKADCNYQKGLLALLIIWSKKGSTKRYEDSLFQTLYRDDFGLW